MLWSITGGKFTLQIIQIRAFTSVEASRTWFKLLHKEVAVIGYIIYIWFGHLWAFELGFKYTYLHIE